MNPLTISLLVVGVVVAYFVDARVFAPRRRVKSLADLKERAKTMDPRALENPKYGILESEGDSLRIVTKSDRFEIHWDDIEEVHAFKRDIFTVDLICLAFKRCGKEEFLEVHEEMAGYHDMLKKLPNRLSGFSDAWFAEVAFPAFETNHRVVWRREKGPNKSPEPMPLTRHGSA